MKTKRGTFLHGSTVWQSRKYSLRFTKEFSRTMSNVLPSRKLSVHVLGVSRMCCLHTCPYTHHDVNVFGFESRLFVCLFVCLFASFLDTIMKCGWTRFFLRSYILWCSSVLMNFPPVNHIYHEITGPYGWWFNILFFFNCLAATQLARQLHWHQERTQIDQKKPLPPGRFPIYYFPWSKPEGKGLPSK